MAIDYRTATPRWKREADWQARRAAESRSAGRELGVDRILLLIVLALTLFGAVMVYSASAIIAEKSFGNQFHFLYKQGVWALVGLVAMAIGMKIDYRHYKQPRIVFPLLAVTAAMLVVVLFLPKVNETHRWIRYAGFSLQPSEVAKLALTAYLAYLIESRERELDDFKRVFIPATVVGGFIIVMVAAEPDLGTAMALGIVYLTVTFYAGVPLRYLALVGAAALPGLAGMLLLVPWRLQRLMDFLDPWKNQTTSSFQVVQSLIAVGSGGAQGVGFAQGKQKLFYLPAPHTDFIFAVIGEELGLIGSVAVVGMFALLAWRGFRAARSAPDLFGQLLATGLTVMIIAQALFNISVTLSLVPTKGIPLPFISSGGSSLAISLFAAGVLLNVSKHEKA
ncbi:MAG TPA: putative lipid II flippase FtsW [Blastocatellia bacterium]|nr:putative lipid II flippase FtsW [Blastocatellia bacterium]